MRPFPLRARARARTLAIEACLLCAFALAGLATVGRLAACDRSDAPDIVVYTPAPSDAADPDGLALAATDLAAAMARLDPGATIAEAHLPAAACQPGHVRLAVLDHAHAASGAPQQTDLAPQEYTIDETRCGDGHLVLLRGGSLLASQWAVYDLLERLGVRFLHPEVSVYPDSLVWPAAPIQVRTRPAFARRSMHVHTTHPVELSPPRWLGDVDLPGITRRWIDWNVALRQSDVDGFDPAIVGNYAYRRGFPRHAGFNLLNSQQGGRPVLDPDDPRPESEQLAEAIDEAMAPVAGQPDPSIFDFQFNPSEFTTVDDRRTVERLDFVTRYLGDHYPGVPIFTINHGTAQGPTPTYGIRFFDLPELAPPALGVKVHPLMFYDLERPAAGVYGNPDYRHLLDWIIAQQAVRRIIHYPEASWWLTFDLPVPLYLAPATLEARQRDIDLLAPYLSSDESDTTGVWGHHLFTSGQEWGYWLIDYCTAHMVFSLDTTGEDCLDDVTGLFAAGDEVRAVLGEVAARQVVDLRDPELLRFLVGSDDETEAAAAAGIIVHPLPPAPADILGLDDEAAAALESRSLAPLAAMAADYQAFSARIDAALAVESAARAPWLREIRDGLRIFGLRAEHAVEIYRTALDLRAALAAGDLPAVEAARAGVARARAVTERARAVVTAREADYRYPPQLTIDGDEAGTPGAVENRTVYPYRYLSRTHRLFYWVRPDDQLAALFGEGLERVRPNERILRAGTPLAIVLVADAVSAVHIVWGDGSRGDGGAGALAPHTYGAQEVYDWVLDASHAGGAIHHADQVAVVSRRLVFPRGALKVEAPRGASLVEGLLPGFVVGLGEAAGGPFLALGRLDGKQPVTARGGLYRRSRAGLASGPADLSLELASVGPLTVHDAVITVGDGAGPEDRHLAIEGDLETAQIVSLLVGAGGFDEQGARNLVAGILGFTPDTLPERVAFRIAATGTEPE